MNARIRAKKKSVSLGRKPIDPNEWVYLADELYEWSLLPSSINFDDFALTKGFGPMRFRKWVKENEYFQERFEMALYEVGLRRLSSLRDKDKLIMRTLPLYDLALAEYEQSINKENDLVTYEEFLASLMTRITHHPRANTDIEFMKYLSKQKKKELNDTSIQTVPEEPETSSS
jgi:hypothetical protein